MSADGAHLTATNAQAKAKQADLAPQPNRTLTWALPVAIAPGQPRMISQDTPEIYVRDLISGAVTDGVYQPFVAILAERDARSLIRYGTPQQLRAPIGLNLNELAQAFLFFPTHNQGETGIIGTKRHLLMEAFGKTAHLRQNCYEVGPDTAYKEQEKPNCHVGHRGSCATLKKLMRDSTRVALHGVHSSIKCIA